MSFIHAHVRRIYQTGRGFGCSQGVGFYLLEVVDNQRVEVKDKEKRNYGLK